VGFSVWCMDVGETLVDEGRQLDRHGASPASARRGNEPAAGLAPGDTLVLWHRPIAGRLATAFGCDHIADMSALSFAATPLPARSSSMSTPTRWLLPDALRCRVIQVCEV